MISTTVRKVTILWINLLLSTVQAIRGSSLTALQSSQRKTNKTIREILRIISKLGLSLQK